MDGENIIRRLKEIWRNEKFPLYCALLIGFLLLFIQAFFSYDLFRDSASVYSPMARAFAAADYANAFHPGIPCLNVILSRPLTCIGLSPETALGVIGSAFYVATIPFIYLLMKLFLPVRLASMGSLLFACAPKIIRFSCSAIIDSGKVFFLVAALYFLITFIQSKYRAWTAGILSGFALGGLTLARSEGFGNACVLMGMLGLWFIAESVRDRKIYPVSSVLTAVACWGLCLLSRVWVNWHFCHAFVFDQRLSDGISGLLHSPAKKVEISMVAPLRVDWADLLNQNLRGSYELYFGLAIAGVLLILIGTQKWGSRVWPDGRRPDFVKWNSFYWIFLLVPISNAVIFKMSDLAAYRYFLLNIPCFLVFTLTGCYFVWLWSIKYLPRFLILTAVAIMLFCQIQNGISNIVSVKSKQQYLTGKYLEKLLAPEKETARIWFTNACIEWYYSGLKRAVPIEGALPDIGTFTDFDYILWGKNQEGLEILEKREDLVEVKLPDTFDIRLFKRRQ